MAAHEVTLASILATLTVLLRYSGGVHWVPQLGTVQYPKTAEWTGLVRKGEITKVHGDYYKALADIDFSQNPGDVTNLPAHGDVHWKKLERGTYMLPKTFGVDDDCIEGDVFYEPDEELYYRAHGTGSVPVDWKNDIEDGHHSTCQWTWVDDKENWMSLLRPVIGDVPLGDLVIPGTHDSATSGIDENCILIDRNLLYQVAERLSPDFIANWTRTHSDKLDLQLTAGFRQLDLRIADTEEIDGQFRWWHGATGDEISEGLQQVDEFAQNHPEEVLIVYFGHFAAPGNALAPTVPISLARRDNISDTILEYLGDHMTYSSNLTSNPTMNEVLATGRNIITIVDDSYIRNKDDRYWEVVVYDAWTQLANPEEIFNERSERLKDFKEAHAHEMTDLSGAVTADQKVLVSALVNVYGDNDTVWDIILEIQPGLAEVNTANMSFEGLWIDLFSMGRYGINTQGMHVRPSELYSNGASVHYSGGNDQVRHWVARPDLYKPNIIYIDDFLTSTLVDTAIQANKGEIPREVTIALQGNPKSGYFEWDDIGFGTIGGTDGINCTAIDLRYTISDQSGDLAEGFLYQQGLIDIPEGLYPPDATISLAVMSEGSSWNILWSSGIQDMIAGNLDVYIRGNDLEEGNGFAYISTTYDDYGMDCSLPPLDISNILQLIEW